MNFPEFLHLFTPDEHVRDIHLTCRCGHDWVERLPDEIYNSQHIRIGIECLACHQQFVLFRQHFRMLNIPWDSFFEPETGDANYVGQTSTKKYRYDA